MNLLSGLYGRVAEVRRAWYERHPDRRRRLARPVISVGNLVVGGSGKTPTVATIARLLVAEGERPAILSRGYARKIAADGVVVVSDGEGVIEPTRRSGDEPQMLARALPGVPVLVSQNRYLAGLLAERRFGCTVHLLDDGFQHVQLASDVSLLLVSEADVHERLLPFGRLREPLGASRAADALLVAGTEADVVAVSSRLAGKRAFHISARYATPRPIPPAPGSRLQAPGRISDPESRIPDHRRVIAVAGIARPDRFFNALRAEGWDIVQEFVFRDHHWFSRRDLEGIRAAAQRVSADAIMTTEKDAMRLDSHQQVLAPHLVAFLPMEIVIEPGDEFMDWLRERIASARAARAAEAA